MERRLLSEMERAEIWARWKCGESQRRIARSLGVQHPTIHKVLRRTGGWAPTRRHRASRVLTSAEREDISRGLAGGLALATIARQIGRVRSTVTREVARNGGRAAYRARQADPAAALGAGGGAEARPALVA